MNEQRTRIVVGMTGASGQIYGITLVKALHDLEIETHLVISPAAKRNLLHEFDAETVKQLEQQVDVVHHFHDIGASLASGSFQYRGMVIAPCSINTMSALATGRSDNLITRAGDVTLKERRRLILLVREEPLHAIHLRNMLRLAEAGAIIFPAMTTFYIKPKTIQDIVDHTVGRILDLLGIENQLHEEWQGDLPHP
ncbi:MAG: UbiX family flavin prenyltransferase [Candidatus Bipolaricaulia bacterium]